MTASRTVTREANAKINLFLRVTGMRPDGYHEIESLVVPISLADTVTVTDAASLEVEITGVDERTAGVPVGGLNLAIVAALALGSSAGGRGAHISIEKRIPSAAGLGGGSADAAATLHALNELWRCDLDIEALALIAERVGSDVPALLLGGSVLVGGRGEHLSPVEVAPFSWVLLHGERGVGSPDAYRWWDEEGGVAGPDPSEVLAAAASGDAAVLAPLLFNDLQAPVEGRHPEIREARERLLAAGALAALMSGSGSSVVGLASGPSHAREIASRLPGSEAVVSGMVRGDNQEQSGVV